MAVVVTIDGPAASGKSSVSREVAKRKSWKWVSTGAFYRGLAYVAKATNTNLENEDDLLSLVDSSQWHIEMQDEKTAVILNGEDVTTEIHTESVGAVASKISQYPRVRAALLAPQRDLQNNVNGLVAEGRDCGSVVFPKADMKIYLTASEKLRAQRRAEQTGEDLEKVAQKTEARDAADSSRKAAPLHIPEGAIVIETSDLDFDAVVNTVLEKIKNL